MEPETFNAGVPTEPEVNMLREKFGSPVPGTVISYDQIEQTIKVPKTASRFRTVLNAWRAKLDREHNILLGAIPSVGFKVMNSSERVNHSGKTYKKGLRSISKSVRVASTTSVDSLSPDEMRARTHFISTGGTLLAAARTQAKAIGYSFSQKVEHVK